MRAATLGWLTTQHAGEHAASDAERGGKGDQRAALRLALHVKTRETLAQECRDQGMDNILARSDDLCGPTSRPMGGHDYFCAAWNTGSHVSSPSSPSTTSAKSVLCESPSSCLPIYCP